MVPPAPPARSITLSIAFSSPLAVRTSKGRPEPEGGSRGGDGQSGEGRHRGAEAIESAASRIEIEEGESRRKEERAGGLAGRVGAEITVAAAVGWSSEGLGKGKKSDALPKP